MINIYINNKEYSVPSYLTILQAIEYTNHNIPHFCYHETLMISGNCRMCLVEVEKMPKPAIACALTILNNMKIFTNTPLIQKVRENILEFLLINHPLDCPICDQGGECDLQNYSLNYGSDRSRFFENKRSVSDKYFNPLIKAIMSRCIHCTRCIRFITDISGLDVLGTTGRGNNMEIGLYNKNIIKNEFSGNIIDLCPVGALTSKVYAFKARPWELRTINFIDIFDSIGMPIQIYLKSNNIINRVTPFKDFEINNFWISDRTRFSYDAFNIQKLENPLIKRGNQFIKTTWQNAYYNIFLNIKFGNIVGIFGEHIDIINLFIFKKFLNNMGSSYLINDNNYNLLNNNDNVDSFLINDSLLYKSDIYLLVGFDPRFELSILNLKLKENSINNNNFECYNIGKPLNLNFKNKQLGWNIDILLKIIEGKHSLSKKLINNNSHILINNDLNLLINFKSLLHKKNITISFINQKISKINSNYLNSEIRSSSIKSILKRNNVFYFLDSNIILDKIKNNFIIFQGSLGNDNLKNSNIILPTNLIYEKNNFFINIFGKFIETIKCTSFLKNIKDDFKIFISLLLFFNISKLKNFYNFKYIDKDISKNYPLKNIFISNNLLKLNSNYNNYNIKLIENIIHNYYLNSKITELSLIMQNCSKLILLHKTSYSISKKFN